MTGKTDYSSPGRDSGWMLPVALSILAAALILRLWGIRFGLPHLFHGDEGFEVRRALQLGTGSYNFVRIFKGGYFYLLFVEYGGLFAWLKLTGAIDSAKEFGQLYFRDPTYFYLIGRATTAVIGTLTVWMCFTTGRRAFDARVGLIAAVLIAFNVLHARLSHYITVDVPMTCLVLVSMFYAIRMTQTSNRRDYWFAAFFAALAIATKLPAAVILLPLVIAHWFVVANTQAGWREAILGRDLWTAALVFLVTYVIVNPGVIVNFDSLAATIIGLFGDAPALATEIEELPDDWAPPTTDSLFVYYLLALRQAMHLPILIVCLAGLAWGLYKRRQADVLLIAFIMAYYVGVSSSSGSALFVQRYILPVIPFLVILGARLLVDLADRLAPARATTIAGAVAIALSVMPAIEIAQHNHWISQKDTRTEAKEWFDRNVADGASVFIEGLNGRVLKKTIPLKKSRDNLRAYIEYFRANDPPKARFFQTELAAHEGITHDLHIASNMDVRDYSEYKADGVEYFVVRPDEFEASNKKTPLFAKLVDDLRADPDARLVKTFTPDPRTKPGFLIEVYRVRQSDDTAPEASFAPNG